MGCRASADRYEAEVEDEDEEHSNEKRREVSPPAAILIRDFSSMLTLSFRGEGLKDGERSFLVVYTKPSGENLWTELGKTEVCSLDTTWPVWGTLMELEFRVEVMRLLRCEAYKMMSGASLDELWQHKFIGACEFMLTEAVTSRAKVHTSSDGWLRKKLANIHRKRGEKHPGRICVFADEKHASKLELYFKMTASQLQTGEFWKRKPDAFFVVNRCQVVGTDEWNLEELGLVPCYRSEVARRTKDPRFGNAMVTAAQVANGVGEQDFVITLQDWDRLGVSRVLGETVLNFNELWKAAGERNLRMPLCKREGPRLKNMLRHTYGQVKKQREMLTIREPRRTFSGALVKLGSRMGSTTFGSMGKSLSRTFSRSLSSVKDPSPGTPTYGSESKDLRGTAQAFPSESKDSSGKTRRSEMPSKDQRSSSHGSGKDSIGRARRSPFASKDNTANSDFGSEGNESAHELRRQGSRRSGGLGAQRAYMPGSKTSVQRKTKRSLFNRASTVGTSLGPGEKTLFFGPVVGQLVIQDMILDRSYTFLDYVRGGLELRMMLGIDFTRSNMDVMNPDSLHSQCEKGLATAYEDAICSLGQVLRSYDTSNEYYVYGFGAKIPPSHTVCSNCFALTGDFLFPKVKGLDGILQAYRRALNVVQLHGPSDCAEVLNLAGRFAKKFVQEPEKEMLRSSVPPDMLYFVLLILTDGEMESEKKVVEELRELQAYPISVLFIGIGSKDFRFMRELPDAMALWFEKDFEKPKLENVSKRVCRRVVQFVQYSEYESNPDGLVAATLADLPREIVLYYRMLGVKPRGLERFENRFGEPLPTPLPKAAKLEFKAAEQRTADRKTRETVMATRMSSRGRDDASKDSSGSGPRSLNRTTSRQSHVSNLQAMQGLEGDDSTIASSRLTLHHAAEEEEEEDEEPVNEQAEAELLSSSSEEDVHKPSKREEDNLPVFLQEEKKRLLEEAMAIGYKKHQITRAVRDGIPSASVEVLLDNIRYSGYGKLPSYKEAAVASLPDDAPLPWNPFKTQAENEKKIKQLDDELEDYGAQLLALASPAKNEVSRHEVLSRSGIFTCKRSRVPQPRQRSPSPKSPPTPSGGSPALRRTNTGSSLGNGPSLTSTRSLRNLPEAEQEPASPKMIQDHLTGSMSPKSTGDAEKRVEEAAQRVRSLHAKPSKGREGEYPPIIKEVDERIHEEDRYVPRPDGTPATLSAPTASRLETKLSSSYASSRAISKDVFLE